MDMKRWHLGMALVALLALTAVGCDAEGPKTDSAAVAKAGKSRLRVLIHDKPTVEVDEVWVVFDEVRAIQEDGTSVVLSTEVQSMDLLSLQNGVVEELADAEVPPGSYTQIRLHLTDAWVVVDGATAPLKVPSGEQSGLKIKPDGDGTFDIPECGTVTVTLDWDAGAHLNHNKGQGFILRPVIAVESVTESNDGCGCSGEVNFPDPAMEAQIRSRLNQPTGPLLAEDVATITQIQGLGAGITDLTGLECATGLTYVDLRNNTITDVTPLANATLVESLFLDTVSASAPKITDISALSGMTQLTRLALTGHDVTDLSPIAGATGMTILGLLGTDVEDLSPLAGMTQLTVLDLRNTFVNDLSPIAGATGMTQLFLDTVKAGVPKVTDISPLSGMTGLTRLAFNGHEVVDLSPIAGATGITQLGFNSNAVTDLSPLSGMTQLVVLDARSNFVSDLSPLANATGLSQLFLDSSKPGPKVTDLSPLSGLTSLTWLFLGGQDVTDLSPITGAVNLSRLALIGNEVSDLSPLSGLTQLTFLDLRSNPVSDTTPLAGKCSLTAVYLSPGLIACPDATLEALKACVATVDYGCP